MSFVRSDISESSWFCSNTCFHSGHQQVANPIIPYVGPIISGGLKPGMALYVQGTVPDNANQFSINFQTGQNKYDDIAFYFNPWIGQYVYLNSFQNGNWEEKECVLDESFTRGAAFNMFIVTKTDGYEVYVNDLRRYMFQHRIPLEKVTTLCICGDVSIDFFGLCENWRRSSFREQAITSTESLLLNMLPIPSEVSHQVIHPILPHVGTIGDRLKPEMAVFFQGALPAHPKEFEINFQTGQSDSDDIAFHFNPRIGKHVYLNSFRNGSWEKEECVSDELFTKGAGFYMFVVISSEGYEVYVNGLQHCMFNHRVPLKNISTISIYGDVTISIYGFIDNWSKSFNFTDLLKITGMGSSFSSLLPILSEVSHPVILPALPYVGTIRGGIRSDTAVFFQGTLPAHAKMFAINFQTGQSDSDDIAFHFNPRIGKHVYLNSFRNASWEKEETAPDKLFTKGAAFNMFVVISSEGYEVYVNGVQLCIFKHRIPLESISTLAIFGDISVAIYGFIDNWSRSPLCMDRSNATGCRSSFSKQLSVPSEVSHPVIQPALPYMGTIKEEIRPDMAVLFHGTVSEHGKSFEINLLTGDSDYDDIAFHISPRIGKSMALNSFINGSWETEEYASDNPFSKGTSFNLFFVINSEGYEVYINSLQHCTFKHRIPLEKVSTLGIRGDVTINYFGFVENWSTSSMARKINEIPEKLSISGNLMHIPSEISHPVINPELPYVGSIPEGLRTDMAVFLKVALPADAKVFTINFQTGESDGDDIAFHINPRIGELVALNSFRNGSWETEEHASITPFAKEGALNMNIVINSEGYEVYVNGLQHCTFKHRIPLENVSTLGICGDVIINYFGFVENWSESSMAVEMNDIQDMSITSGSLIDVPSEISHPLSSPESPHVDTVPEALKTDKAVIFQVALPADANNAVNFKITHRGSENWNELSMVVESNEIQDMSMITGSLIDVPSEISHPISSPELPYVGAIPGGLKTDMAVIFQGNIPADAKEFKINFQTGESDGENIAFHINPRIGELVALNSFRNGSWETEEHASITPFAKEGALNMNIVINSEGYEVCVNGLQHCTFKHRIPLENVSTLGICGDVIINYFGFVENWSESSMAVEMNDIQDMSITSGSLIDVPSEISHPLSSPESAHVDTVPEALKTDKAVIFQVALPADANNAVNFKITHRGSENWNESSMVVESNEIQDMSLITGSLIDVPSEISHPISSPELPYVGAIPGGLKTDMAVIFQGNIPADAKEFKINFQTGESDGENIAFHINPRIGELVALNSFRNGSWETEEHASITPFAKEGALNMNIVINSEGYEVCVNGLQHCTFKHRIPLENVSTLGICGDVIINYFGFVENWSRSSLALENKQSTEMRSTSVTLLPITTDKLTLPFVGSIPGGIRADMAVLFYGTILADSNEFEINFQTCQSSDDIAFNINPQIVRFLVLSSLRNGEDLASDNGAAFNMFVVLKLEGYEVYVNGLQYCTFKHCIPLETISSLGIRGDVFINFIGFIDNWSSSSMVMENIKITGMERSCWRPIPIPSQVSHPVSNPALPYVGLIPGKARPDMAVLFQGALPADANEFTINFQTGLCEWLGTLHIQTSHFFREHF
ncbi:uncharacterized protein LOC108264058 isoform X2 [Ictalurus punctatus]|uniref:Uncharacterized protein LOC108264058 isoform X2 n=1 Tax=Ictalurus punctatus TaxID=7998 RepID=A0A9F7TFW5_ICTPU|nr:uncharacterized protein LOC108264058 isoform X2 [Ictalurus punctatus]